ncbi:SRPBCC family protein [Actinokineospora enzanensis]|uniref:SRPBCC family protein n=1 Tax=Actinokineospora enzanensis TaxID=155975 RepID=UPI0003A91D18|nr:SRPBCC family protein [Actinokineospora enzanensis]
MTTAKTGTPPLFEIERSALVRTSPEIAYAVVSDLTRSGEWSAECTGGAWVAGTPGTVGAVFRGDNVRAEDVVAWAPVARGHWQTHAEVVAATPGREFGWAMRNGAGHRQESTWSFHLEPRDEGCLLAHRFRMGRATEGIVGITAEMDDEQRRRFFAEWGAKLAEDMAATVERIKAVLESGGEP